MYRSDHNFDNLIKTFYPKLEEFEEENEKKIEEFNRNFKPYETFREKIEVYFDGQIKTLLFSIINYRSPFSVKLMLDP